LIADRNFVGGYSLSSPVRVVLPVTLLEKTMNRLKAACLIGVCLLGLLGGAEAYGNFFGARQYYSGWRRFPDRAYFYRSYYYKPTASFAGYRHHYVIYDPRRPRYLYYYNPYRRLYWGRCLASAEGKAQYSLLAEGDRKASLDDIPEKAFPDLGDLPPIPESDPKEGATMDLPPDDLPDTNTLPKVPEKR
jgi:hypothetical protein